MTRSFRLDDALDLYKQLEHEMGIAYCYNQLGNIARDSQRYGEAQQFHEDALNLYRELSHDAGISQSFLHLGQTAQKLQQYEKAIGFFTEALSIFKAQNSPGAAEAEQLIDQVRPLISKRKGFDI